METSGIKLAEHDCFETERLILRRITLTDASDMFEILNDPEVVRFTSLSPHEEIEQTKRLIVDKFMPNRLNMWGIIYKRENKLIGSIQLKIQGDSPGRSTIAIGGKVLCLKLLGFYAILHLIYSN